MKKLSIRSFQLKQSKYIKELPLILTRYGKEVARLYPPQKGGEKNE